MKNLSLERMENVEGGDVGGCFLLALSVVGVVALATAAAPATLGASIWLSAQAITAGIGVGAGVVDCAD